MGIEPIGLLLTPAGAGEGVVGGPQHGDKNLCFPDLAGLWIDHRQSRPHNNLRIASHLHDGSGACCAVGSPAFQIAVAELGIAVTIIWMLLPVLLPQQLLGDALALELLVDARKVRVTKASLAGEWLCGGTADALDHAHPFALGWASQGRPVWRD